MKHSVKGNKDVILDGKIYKPISGVVDLPRELKNKHVQPISDKLNDEAGAEE